VHEGELGARANSVSSVGSEICVEPTALTNHRLRQERHILNRTKSLRGRGAGGLAPTCPGVYPFDIICMRLLVGFQLLAIIAITGCAGNNNPEPLHSVIKYKPGPAQTGYSPTGTNSTADNGTNGFPIYSSTAYGGGSGAAAGVGVGAPAGAASTPGGISSGTPGAAINPTTTTTGGAVTTSGPGVANSVSTPGTGITTTGAGSPALSPTGIGNGLGTTQVPTTTGTTIPNTTTLPTTSSPTGLTNTTSTPFGTSTLTNGLR